MRREYESPPINELVVGVYFKPPLIGFRSEHAGLFWNKIRDRFPKASQQAPIASIIDAPDEVFPLPRYWFIADDESFLIQVQRNALLANWRRQRRTRRRSRRPFARRSSP